MATVYLGIGSNQGDRQRNIEDAIARLKRNDLNILKCSTIIETDPVDGPPDQDELEEADFEFAEIPDKIKMIEAKADETGQDISNIDLHGKACGDKYLNDLWAWLEQKAAEVDDDIPF